MHEVHIANKGTLDKETYSDGGKNVEQAEWAGKLRDASLLKSFPPRESGRCRALRTVGPVCGKPVKKPQ